jgi:hypothetical protein
MSEQTNLILSDNGLPMRVKNCSKLSIVRSLPIHNSRVLFELAKAGEHDAARLASRVIAQFPRQ